MPRKAPEEKKKIREDESPSSPSGFRDMGMGWGLSDPVPRKAPEEKKKTGEDESPSVPAISETTGGRLLFGGDGKYKKEVRWCSGTEPNERRTVETPVETLKRVVPRESSGFQYSGARDANKLSCHPRSVGDSEECREGTNIACPMRVQSPTSSSSAQNLPREEPPAPTLRVRDKAEGGDSGECRGVPALRDQSPPRLPERAAPPAPTLSNQRECQQKNAAGSIRRMAEKEPPSKTSTSPLETKQPLQAP